MNLTISPLLVFSISELVKNIEILKSSLIVILGLNITFKTGIWSSLVNEPYNITTSELVKNIEIVISSLLVTSTGNDQIGIYKCVLFLLQLSKGFAQFK